LLVIFVFHDITKERANFKLHWKKSEELLRTKHLLQNEIFESLLIFDKKKNILLYNDSFLKNLGHIDDLDSALKAFKLDENSIETAPSPVHQERLTLCEIANDFILNPKQKRKTVNVELHDGEETRVSFEATLFWLVWDGVETVSVIFNEKPEVELNDARDKMMASIVHDLRTPINGMMGVV
jgi:hypothetical protein